MNSIQSPMSKTHSSFPQILPVRRQAEVIYQNLRTHLDTVLPVAMREAELDMWLLLCQEDDLDPVFRTMIPMDTWCPILQVLVFYDQGKQKGIERINISGTNTRDLYDRPYTGQLEEKQWPLLLEIIEARDPQRIGINTGSIQWAAGGLTHNLYQQLVDKLPGKYVDRLESAETAATRWLATLTDKEVEAFEYVVHVAHQIIAECYTRKAIIPGVTTVRDLEWYYWQRSADLGLPLSFRPFFNLVRSAAMKEQHGEDDQVIRAGDVIHCDVGIYYLRLCTDHQQVAYVLRPGEHDAPDGLKQLMAEGNRLQDIFVVEFKRGLTGNEMLHNILTRARKAGVPGPRVYSHSLGLYLHEPGPLIGLPWEQERCPGRGDVRLELNNSFTMELSVTGPVAEWNGQEIRLGLEEDVVFTKDGCRPLDGRQTAFYLV
jgi:Xaa-Pro aminopeptidase